MKSRTIQLAKQLLGSVPKDETEDLIRLLQYYNRFAEEDRVKAMTNGSKTPQDKFLEDEVISESKMNTKMATATQRSYVTTNQNVCRCCGR
jgi:hypothetical protein